MTMPRIDCKCQVMTLRSDSQGINITEATNYDQLRQDVTILCNVNNGQPRRKPTINLVTCRATREEREKLKALAQKYGLAGPSHFFRTCLDRLFEADEAGDLKLPMDLKRTAPQEQEPKRRPKKR
jgi:hypothetical protein